MRSWFSINQWINPERPNSPPIYSPSCATSRVECTVGEVIKAKRIRVYPTTAQKTLFRQWLGTSRFVYNETVRHLGLPKEERERHWMGASKRILANLPEWAKPVPYQHLERLISRIAKAKWRQKARLKKAANRLRWKIRNLVDELHFQAIRFLLDRFDLILLPTFETREMSQHSKRWIRAQSVRPLLGDAFFRFGRRLEAAAKRVSKVVLRVNEAYTSKTASWTGEIKQIGGSRIITSG